MVTTDVCLTCSELILILRLDMIPQPRSNFLGACYRLICYVAHVILQLSRAKQLVTHSTRMTTDVAGRSLEGLVAG